jgi:hypothetical protein
MYKCDKCNYSTDDNSNYLRHNKSKRHLQDDMSQDLTELQKQKLELQQQKLEIEREKMKLKMEKDKQKLEMEKEKFALQKLKMETKIQKEKEKEQKKINDELAKQIEAENANIPIDYYQLDYDTVFNKIKFNIKHEITSHPDQFYGKLIYSIYNEFKCLKVDKTFPRHIGGKPFVSPTKEQIDEMMINNTYVNYVKTLDNLDIPCSIFTNGEWCEEQTVMSVYNDAVTLVKDWKEYDKYKHQFSRAEDLKANNMNTSKLLDYLARVISSCSDGSNYLEEYKEKKQRETEEYNEKILQKRDEEDYKERQNVLDRDKIAERQRKEMEQEESRLDLEAKTELRALSKEVKRIRRSKGSDTDTDLENEIV